MKIMHLLLLSILISCSPFTLKDAPLSWRVPAQIENRAHDEAAREISQVHPGSVAEKVLGLEGARVVVADYDLIRRDFPQLRNLSHDEIDQWLLQNTAYMAAPQAQQEGANTRIELSGKERSAYRPPQYGRALVFQADSPFDDEMNARLNFVRSLMQVADEAQSGADDWSQKKVELKEQFENGLKASFDQPSRETIERSFKTLEQSPNSRAELERDRQALMKIELSPRNHIGLIDAKGVGALAPRAGGHSDGLATLGEAIREYVYEKMVNTVFTHEDAGLRTVGTYAVIDSGFGVKHQDGSASPGGIVLRQAHNRFDSHASLFSEADSLRIENILRKYGITSAGAYRDVYPYDKINVQGTKSGAVLDFGGFLVVERFHREAIHFYGQKVLIDPKRDQLVQPDPNLRIPLEVWGTTVSGKEDPKLDNIWLWSHELAAAFREGRAGRDDVLTHVRNLLGPVTSKLGASKQSCHQLFESLVRFD